MTVSGSSAGDDAASGPTGTPSSGVPGTRGPKGKHGLKTRDRSPGQGGAPDRRRGRRGTWVLLVGIAALAAVSGWVLRSAVQVRDESTAVEATLSSISKHAHGLDAVALAGDLVTLRTQSDALASSSSGAPWSLVSWVPRAGDDVNALQTTAQALDVIARSTSGLDGALLGLAPSRLRAPDGRIDAEALRAAAPALAKVAAALSTARTQVDGIRAEDLVEPLARRVDTAQAMLATAPETLKALASLPAMLGADGPRTYAVLLTNPAELRGAGGFFGGYAIIHVEHGYIRLVKVGPNDDLVNAGRLDVSSLPKEYRALWGASATEWQSVNISPNFPYAGRLTAAGFGKLGTHIDGVIALDSKVAAALLTGTGPVMANGVTISSKNADAYFTREIYAQYPDGAGHKPQALALFGQMFQKLAAGPVDAKAIGVALAPLFDQRRLLVWMADSASETAVSALPVGGVVPDAPGPWTTVALVNGSGNKMDAYLAARVSYVTNRCTAGSGSSTLTLQLTNRAALSLPPYVDQRLDDPAAPKGSTLSLAYVYGPVGSSLVGAELDGRNVAVQAGAERGHPVWRFDVALLRSQTRTLAVRISEPVGDASEAPVVMAQPMEIAESAVATTTACG